MVEYLPSIHFDPNTTNENQQKNLYMFRTDAFLKNIFDHGWLNHSVYEALSLSSQPTLRLFSFYFLKFISQC
jgi:hypothetical protein